VARQRRARHFKQRLRVNAQRSRELFVPRGSRFSGARLPVCDKAGRHIERGGKLAPGQAAPLADVAQAHADDAVQRVVGGRNFASPSNRRRSLAVGVLRSQVARLHPTCRAGLISLRDSSSAIAHRIGRFCNEKGPLVAALHGLAITRIGVASRCSLVRYDRCRAGRTFRAL